MNKQRRKTLASIHEKLTELRDLLEEVRSEEEDCFLAIPDNLQGSERYEKAEETVDNLEEAVGHIDEALEIIENAQE